MALPVLALGAGLKSAAKAIGGFFRAIPLWAWLAFAVMLAAFVYGESKEARGMERGLAKGLSERDKVQAAWNASVARGREEIARLDRDNAAAEAKARAEAIAEGEKHALRLQTALDRKTRDADDLRAGNLKLRHQFQSCLSQAAAGQPAADPFWPDGAEGLRPADSLDLAGAVAGSAFIGDTATADVTALQAIVRSQQEFMRKVCPVVAQ